MADVLLHDFVPPKLGSIVPGEDNSERVNAALERVIDRYASPEKTRVLIRGKITHDSEPVTMVGANAVKLVPEKVGDGFQTLTDTGGLEPRYARRRAHVDLQGCVDSGVCEGLDIAGTKTVNGRSPDIPPAERVPGEPYRDVWEGQSGVRVRGCTGWTVVANIHDVWGDFVECDALYVNQTKTWVGNVDGYIYGGAWSRNGRVAVKCHYNSGLRWQGTRLRRVVSSYLHVESGGNPAGDQKDIHVADLITDASGGNIAHVSGGARLDGLEIHGVLARGRCAQVRIGGHRALALGPASITRVRVYDLLWDQTEEGGPIADFSNIDGLEYGRGCAGPVRKTIDPKLQFRFNVVRRKYVDLSGIRRV